MEELIPRDSLYNWRKKSWDRLQEIGWPKRKLEELLFSQIADETKAIPSQMTPECPYRCVFIDGYFQQELSLLPETAICLPLEQAMRSYGVFLQNRIQRTLKEETDTFALLNGALQGKGVLLYIPPGLQVDGKLEIRHYFTKESTASARIHLYLGKEASLKIVQTVEYASPTFCSNGFFDATIDENSSLDFCDVQDLPIECRFFQSIRASLKRNSRFSSLALMKGAQTARTSYKIQLVEENSEALIQGLGRLEEGRQNSIHALIEHIAPHTRSRQNFKTVLYGKSKSSFEGKIYVRPEAQKTEAYQLNANLPLSSDAEIQSKPNLEIFADDVKASHGATIAQIGEEDLFYLRSRGLSKEDSKRWLIRGFYRDLLDAVPIDSLKKGFVDAEP